MSVKELIELTNENETLQKNVLDLEDALRLLQNQNSRLEEALAMYKEELDENKETLQIKKEELLEKVALIDKLNDELLCLNQELEKYKNKPLEAESKGNSLFAEVDDRRVHLQKTINEIKSNYVRLKQEHNQHVDLIFKLRKEKEDIRNQWKKDLEEMQEDNFSVPETLRRHVKVLEEVIEQQKQQLEQQKALNSDSNLSTEYQFYHQMIEDKSKEIEDWTQKYSNNSISNYMLSREVAQANKKARLLRLELEEMSEKLQEAQAQNVRAEAKECLKCSGKIVNDKRNVRSGDNRVSEGIHLKSCLKNKDEAYHDQTSDFTITKDYVRDDFNILQSEFAEFMTKKETSVETLEIGDISDNNETNSQHDDGKHRTTFDDDKEKDKDNKEDNKENKDSNMGIEREKRGVTFTEDTTDSVSKPVRKRGTHIFVLKKKS